MSIVALIGDDRQLMSMQELRIFGGVDHTLDRENKPSMGQQNRTKLYRENTGSTNVQNLHEFTCIYRGA